LALLSLAAFGHSEKLGVFTNSGDVGDPAMKGFTEFNSSSGEYRITGSGDNIWAKQDQFQYVWKKR
jgi:TolB protein